MALQDGDSLIHPFIESPGYKHWSALLVYGKPLYDALTVMTSTQHAVSQWELSASDAWLYGKAV